MSDDRQWTVQRRHLWDEGPHTWDTVRRAPERDVAEHHYRRLIMYIQCREIRLVSPDNDIVLYYRDPSYFHHRRNNAANQSEMTTWALNVQPCHPMVVTAAYGRTRIAEV